jgi:hypothetical protein
LSFFLEENPNVLESQLLVVSVEEVLEEAEDKLLPPDVEDDPLPPDDPPSGLSFIFLRASARAAAAPAPQEETAEEAEAYAAEEAPLILSSCANDTK